MNVLHVFAHPEASSFNGAMRDVAITTLRECGHQVVESDLYKMHFDPVVGPDDFGELSSCDVFDVQSEQEHAHQTNTFSADIALEQKKILKADLLILQFPMWWFGMPAIIKGWADRVFARGFAYSRGRKYDSGMFRGKTAMVALTTGTSQATYAPDGVDGELLNILWPLHNGLLHYCGFDVLQPYVVHMPGRLPQEERTRSLHDFRNYVMNIENSVPKIYFHPRADYDDDERLKSGIVPRSTFQRNVKGQSPLEDGGA